ncbi:DNA-binding transcriptional MerR regulator [Arthrobacter sp. CAN_A2]|uniref:helix-turn-helix transcriptional regulator n=1 Tax=Arthrobacter sp. CAN_A2 TaxID=2787718 RepID=UPI0018EFD531
MEVKAYHLMTLEEVSEETRVPINTLRFYRHKGEGPKFAKIAGRLMARRADVERWLDAAFDSEESA